MKLLHLGRWQWYLGTLLFVSCPLTSRAAEVTPAPPSILGATVVSNSQQRVNWTPYPAAQQYRVLSSPNVTVPFAPNGAGAISGYQWTAPLAGSAGFHRIEVTPMSSNDLFIANVLNRLTYGPTPDELVRIRSLGPQAYIDEQMASAAITDTINSTPPIVNLPPTAPPLTNWIRVSASGTATSTNFFIYLSAAGRVYLDDVRLVVGTNADVGDNLLVNGDFEDPTLTNGWIVGATYSPSVITNSPTVDGLSASGNNCLLMNGTGAGGGAGTSLQQIYSATNYPVNTRFSLSFSYLPVANVGGTTNILTARLSGSATIRNVPLPWLGPTPPSAPPAIAAVYDRLTNDLGTLDDFRAWHVYRAIHSPRQLHEVLAQFFQNHFTTQYQKTKDYYDQFQYGNYTNENVRQRLSVDLHWREHSKWRDLLLNPNCTFHDLLKVSIESPAMVIYLDTVLNTRTAPNQNYAREILELHTMGADNGYGQQDIVDLARVWTGWRVDKKDPLFSDNVFATPISRTNLTNFANADGSWVLHYTPSVHDTNAKRLFTNVVIDPRFGSQFRGGQPYALTLPSVTPASNTNGFGEGYLVAQHLASLPYTAEFLSVKLCEVFVHEGFEYGIYDYRAANPTAEIQLVKDCMTAWFTPAGDGRTGNIRSVLTTIFNSALFRGHGASQQKVKTPLEYSVSAIRALRVVNTEANGHVTSTCDSDGYGISGTNNNTYPLNRMGGMALFNKPEPDGWSEKGSIWLNTANLCERMRFVQQLLMPATSALKSSDYGSAGLRNTSDPVKLLKLRLPSPSWNDAGAVVDFFMGLLYPGEGRANLDLDRTAAIQYLNTAENGTASPFTGQGHTTAGYDGRVRSMVGFLLSLPRFQEQ